MLRLLATATLFALTNLPAQTNWLSFRGPTGEEWSRLGTDGQSLYFTTAGRQLWRYTWPTGQPNLGTWTRLSDAPRVIDAWDSYRGLAHQNGWLYCSAIPSSGGGRTLLRYQVGLDAWEIWGNPTGSGQDLTLSNTSGNGLFMDPTLPGVGYGAWHAGFQWVAFDWNAQTANNQWMNTGGLGVPDAGWVSRNEDVCSDALGSYYAVKNDRAPGASAGDVIYAFGLGGTPAVVATKPWQAGAGQSIEYLPLGHRLNLTGAPELWLFRGGDGAASSGEGWSNAGTNDLGVFSLSTQTWAPVTLPFFVGQGTDSVVVGDHVFVKSSGSAQSATVFDDVFWVLHQGSVFTTFGAGCPGTGGEPGLSTPNGPPTLGNAAYQVAVGNAPAGAPAVFLVGASSAAWNAIPLPLDLALIGADGCAMRVSAEVMIPLTLGANGTAVLPLPVPNLAYLVGRSLYQQAFVADLGAPNPLRLAGTPGGESIFGR